VNAPLWVLIVLACVNAGLAVWQTIVIVRFETLLTNASEGAHNHFETIRKVRQRGS
jgi:hypothetical protein